MCVCVSGGVTSGEERWDGGKLERGCRGTWGGLSVSLSAGFGGFSLLASFYLSPSLSLSLTVVHKILHCKFTVLQGRLLGGKVEMGLTERRAVQTAGVSTQCWSPVAFQQGQTLRIYLVQPLASFYSNSPLQRMPLIDSSVAGWDFSPSHPCFSLLPPCGVCQRIQCSICEYCAESLFSFSLR